MSHNFHMTTRGTSHVALKIFRDLPHSRETYATGLSRYSFMATDIIQ